MSIIDRTKIGFGPEFQSGLMSIFQENRHAGNKIVIGITHDPFASYHGQVGEPAIGRGQMVLVTEGRNLKRIRRDFDKLEKQLSRLMNDIGSLPVERVDDWEVNDKAAYFYVYAWIQ